MIFGIGVDLCDTSRLKKLYQKYGDKFAHRILTDNEFNQFKKRAIPEQFLATRFAAKEAAVKALGTGFTNGIGFHSIEITNHRSGKPHITFHDKALSLSHSKEISSSHLSLSDEKSHVVAMVVLEI